MRGSSVGTQHGEHAACGEDWEPRRVTSGRVLPRAAPNGESWRNQVHEVASSIADAMARYAGCEVPFSMAMTRRVTAASPGR